MMKVRRALVASAATALASACMPEPLAAKWLGEATHASSLGVSTVELRLEPVSSDDGTARYDAEFRADTPEGLRGARGWLEEDLELAAVTMWLLREPEWGGLAQCADHGEWPDAEGDVGFRGGVSEDRQVLDLQDNILGPCHMVPPATLTPVP